MRSVVGILAALLLATLPSAGEAAETTTLMLADGTRLQAMLVLPEGYDPAEKYEALLAFPGGEQSLDRARSTVARFWEPEAKKRGVVVVVPAAPSLGRPFYMGEGSIALVPEIVSAMRAAYSIKDGPIHLGGHSNGGITAFRAAIRYPELFQSLTVIAGVPVELVDFDRLDRLKGMKIAMFVGAADADFRGPMTETHAEMDRLGVAATYAIVRGSGHALEAMSYEKSGPVFDTVVPAPAR